MNPIFSSSKTFYPSFAQLTVDLSHLSIRCGKRSLTVASHRNIAIIFTLSLLNKNPPPPFPLSSALLSVGFLLFLFFFFPHLWHLDTRVLLLELLSKYYRIRIKGHVCSLTPVLTLRFFFFLKNISVSSTITHSQLPSLPSEVLLTFWTQFSVKSSQAVYSRLLRISHYHDQQICSYQSPIRE